MYIVAAFPPSRAKAFSAPNQRSNSASSDNVTPEELRNERPSTVMSRTVFPFVAIAVRGSRAELFCARTFPPKSSASEHRGGFYPLRPCVVLQLNPPQRIEGQVVARGVFLRKDLSVEAEVTPDGIRRGYAEARSVYRGQGICLLRHLAGRLRLAAADRYPEGFPGFVLIDDQQVDVFFRAEELFLIPEMVTFPLDPFGQFAHVPLDIRHRERIPGLYLPENGENR